MIENLIEILLVYVSYLFTYPIVVGFLFIESRMEFIIWLLIAISCLYITWRHKKSLLKPFIAIWLLPGVIICGSAAPIPWPFALWNYLNGSVCITLLSVLTTLLMNFLVVYLVAFLFLRVRQFYSSKELDG